MEDNYMLIAVLTILAIHFLFKKYIEATKDAPSLYLEEQSLVETTRLTNQSAIYKSNKLDYGNGLRVGLEIRYDHYKLRNGNFCDIWELLINGLKRHPLKVLQLNDDSISIKSLNFKVDKLGQYLTENDITGIALRYDEFLGSMNNFILILACLVNAVVINFYEEDVASLQNVPIQSLDYAVINQILSEDGELLTFENVYTFEKDKGARIRLNHTLNTNSKIVTNTEYLPINFASSVSATIKHLPFKETITSKDNILIVNSRTKDLVTYVLNKILVGFVCNSNITIIDDRNISYKSWDQSLDKYNTSILFLDHYINDELINQFKDNLSLFNKLKFKQALSLLSSGKFSKFGSLNLRLIYFNKLLDDSSTPLISSLKLNELRAMLNCRIITEYSYNNLIGPVIQNDFYDYRILSDQVTTKLIGHGCIFQSLEIKLVNLDHNDFGDIMVRGYNIGKVNSYFIGKGLAERTNKDNEGFMLLHNIKGKWGNDGCLYVYSF